ncbi:MAG: TatD family hydrolase [Akkermansiaceae bacterium]|nr:TatD family hydrolase [Akkermansiaceae bacterium]NNM30442.1 TatD family hydrolase [Akkermansiaceae bacterium]
MSFRDAHNHLHDPRLAPHLDQIIADLATAGVTRCVVNGTCEDDWPLVAGLARRHPDLVHPSFGLHPWKAPLRTPGWLPALRDQLEAHPGAGLGECGLDRWIQPHDLADQSEVFAAQLEIAAELNLPLTIHCLRAWGPLLEILRGHPRPRRGFLLHSYGGSAELIAELLPLGAYFSFSGHFLAPHKSSVRAAFTRVPAGRLLAETDAPDMLPPEPLRTHPLEDPEGAALNHPAHLPAIVAGLAAARDESPEILNEALNANFERFFGPEGPAAP